MKKTVLRLVLTMMSAGLVGCSGLASQSGGTEPAQHGAQTKPVQSVVPPELLYRVMVAEFALKQGQLQVALDNYMVAARETQDPKVAERATRIAEYTQSNPKIIESAQFWVNIDADNPAARMSLALGLMRDGQTDAALSQLETVMSLADDEQARTSMQLATVLARENNRDGALDLLQRLAQRDVDNRHLKFAVAHLATRFHQFDTALKAADESLATKPDWPDAIILRARILQLQKENEQALAYFAEQVDKYGDDSAKLRMAYARLLMDVKRLDEARTQYVALAEQTPQNGDVLYAAALLSLQAKEMDDAETYLMRLYEQRKHFSEASFYLGQVAESRRQYDKAMDWYGRVRGGELYLDAQMRVATLYAKQNRFDEALQQARSIHTRDSRDRLKLYLLEGDIMVEAGQYHKAFEIYGSALEDMPDNSNLLYARALAAEKIDRLDVVESDLRTILDQDPDNVQALNALGYTLADRTERYHEALQLIRRAFELNPRDAAIMDSMGWIHYRLGNHREALRYLRKAMELMDDVEIAAHLGEVLWIVGKKEEAIGVWNSALDQSPDNKMILDVMRRFGL